MKNKNIGRGLAAMLAVSLLIESFTGYSMTAFAAEMPPEEVITEEIREEVQAPSEAPVETGEAAQENSMSEEEPDISEKTADLEKTSEAEDLKEEAAAGEQDSSAGQTEERSELQEPAAQIEEDSEVEPEEEFVLEKDIPVHEDLGDENLAHVVLFVEFQDAGDHQHEDAEQEQCFLEDAQSVFDLLDGDEPHPRALKRYLDDLSDGEIRVKNLYPQYDDESEIFAPYALPEDADRYEGQEDSIIEDALEQWSASGYTAGDLDLDEDGRIDFVTVVVFDETGTLPEEYIEENYEGDVEIGGLKAGRCAIVSADSLDMETGEPEILTRAILHALGAEDLYTEETEEPVQAAALMLQPEEAVQPAARQATRAASAVYGGVDYSAVYDYDYYISRNPDVQSAYGNDQAKILGHFVKCGMSEGRQGNEAFNVYTYKNRYADLRSAYGSDLKFYYLHYINEGRQEGRSGKGSLAVQGAVTVYGGVDYADVYSFSDYIRLNGDVKSAYGDDDVAALEHFVKYGMSEGRQAKSSFNVYTYKNKYPDLRAEYKNDLKSYYLHYIRYGRAEGRSGSGTSGVVGAVTVYNGTDYSAVYDFSYYSSTHGDIRQAYGDDDVSALEHFVKYGMSEGRQAKNSFNVYTYKNKYPDLRATYKNDLKSYYLHYIRYGRAEGRSGSGTSVVINPVTVYNGIDYAAVYDYQYYVSTNADVKTAYGYDDEAVLRHFVLNGMSEGRQGSAGFNVRKYKAANGDLERAYGNNLEAYYMHYILYGKNEGRNGNPNVEVPPDDSSHEDLKDRYYGYYEGYKITSKKGIQGASEAYTEDLRVQHVLLNVDMADLVSTTPKTGYISYVYKGQTYYFQDLIALKKTVYDLHGWGSTDGNRYGENHMRSVTFNLLLSWKDELSYLIHPSARKKGAAPYYAFNMQEEKARNTFEALFQYLGEEFGTDYKERVSNWVLGNEVNSCNAWNYSGGMSLQDCVANYAQAFQLLDKGVHQKIKSSRVFISLDHCWNASEAGHSGKAFLDEFAAYMNRTAPSVQWNVNYHPYSQPLSRTAFWGDFSNTTDSVSTGYISMRNIQVLTDYLGTLESKYGKISGSIRVIIGELGYSASGGNSGSESQQAAALGYGYYKAMFNTRIDAYIIRAYLDDPAETRAGLYLGLRRADSAQTAKASYEVYKNLDTTRSLEYMNQYLGTVGLSSWESAIPGFDAGKLTAVDF